MAKRRGVLASFREGGSVDRAIYVVTALIGAVLVGLALASDQEEATKVALAAFGAALFFGATSLLWAARRDAAASVRHERFDGQMGELIAGPGRRDDRSCGRDCLPRRCHLLDGSKNQRGRGRDTGGGDGGLAAGSVGEEGVESRPRLRSSSTAAERWPWPSI
jgi:hypothetical protein